MTLPPDFSIQMNKAGRAIQLNLIMFCYYSWVCWKHLQVHCQQNINNSYIGAHHDISFIVSCFAATSNKHLRKSIKQDNHVVIPYPGYSHLKWGCLILPLGFARVGGFGSFKEWFCLTNSSPSADAFCLGKFACSLTSYPMKLSLTGFKNLSQSHFCVTGMSKWGEIKFVHVSIIFLQLSFNITANIQIHFSYLSVNDQPITEGHYLQNQDVVYLQNLYVVPFLFCFVLRDLFFEPRHITELGFSRTPIF